MSTLITSLTIRMNAKYLSFPEQENYKTKEVLQLLWKILKKR